MDSLFISFDLQSDAPIYVQLRNKIIEGIASKQLNPGDTLPSVRNLAKDLGVNMHTINKAYQLLKTDGFIQIHRQRGVVINPDGFPEVTTDFLEKVEEELRPLIAEAICRGMSQEDIRRLCDNLYHQVKEEGAEE